MVRFPLQKLLMFHSSQICLRFREMMSNRARRTRHDRARRLLRGGLGIAPVPQILKARDDKIRRIVERRHPRHEGEYHKRYDELQESMYGKHNQIERLTKGYSQTFAAQGLGDDEPMSSDVNPMSNPMNFMKYESPRKALESLPPPVPYNEKLRRKLLDGALWPSVPDQSLSYNARTLRYLPHETDLRPRVRERSEELLYWIARDLKSCPPSIAENIDFTQVIVERVIFSNMYTLCYVVWSVMDSGARFQIEPHVAKLSFWVKELIIRRFRNGYPKLPKVMWVYDDKSMRENMPKADWRAIQKEYQRSKMTLKDRLEHLRKADTVQARLAGTPWFMPYLWAKDYRALRRTQMTSNLDEIEEREKRKVSKFEAAFKKPSYAR